MGALFLRAWHHCTTLSPITHNPRSVADRKTPPKPALLSERRRYFQDPDGIHWEVREVRNHDYDRRGGYCLIFESAGAVRRVRRYPPDWYEQPEAALFELSRNP
jgi:hypothetical protein